MLQARPLPRSNPSWLTLRTCIAALASILATATASANSYQFLAAPEVDLNRIYRLDMLTGEVGACQFALNPGKTDIAPGSYGITLCYPAGEGAQQQEPGEYGLIASHDQREGGVYRVNFRTGTLSSCYVYNAAVVCTPQAK